MRRNGFKRPFHKLQIVSWVYCIFIIGCYSFLAIPLFPYQIKVFVAIFFTFLFIFVFTFGFICTYIDPSDPALAEAEKAMILSKSPNLKKYPKICKLCKKHVNSDTKHCRDCNRCVIHFDHHCKWLNNCIGIKNYKYYAYLLGSFEIFNLLICISGGFVVSGVLKQDQFYERLSQNVALTPLTSGLYVSMLFIMEILSLVVCVANSQLIIFHMFLGFKKMTTYEFILERRKNRDKYRVSNIKIINEREAIEEVPLEEVFEPYVENPQFDNEEIKIEHRDIKVLPQNYEIPPLSDSEKSVEQSQ